MLSDIVVAVLLTQNAALPPPVAEIVPSLVRVEITVEGKKSIKILCPKNSITKAGIRFEHCIEVYQW